MFPTPKKLILVHISLSDISDRFSERRRCVPTALLILNGTRCTGCDACEDRVYAKNICAHLRDPQLNSPLCSFRLHFNTAWQATPSVIRIFQCLENVARHRPKNLSSDEYRFSQREFRLNSFGESAFICANLRIKPLGTCFLA